MALSRKELHMFTQNTAQNPSLATAPKWALHIVLAEDNRQLRNLLATALYSDGHNVDEVTDARELIGHVTTSILAGREDEIDLIISEQELPVVPGVMVLAGLRARGHAIPFVLMTGDEAVQVRAKELGAVTLDRPFNLGAIREAIRRAIVVAASAAVRSANGQAT
jgi:two-component system chemotaxis response regulator CheY